MAIYYFITATAPATLMVSGKRMNLSPGDSRGPFSEAEKNQILQGPDRRRLIVTPFEKEGAAPAPVKSTPVDGFGLTMATAPSEAMPSEVPVTPSVEDVPSLATADSLLVVPTDVNEPLTAQDLELQQQSVGEVLPPSPTEDFPPAFTATAAPLFTEEETLGVQDETIELAQTEDSARSRRRRRSTQE